MFVPHFIHFPYIWPSQQGSQHGREHCDSQGPMDVGISASSKNPNFFRNLKVDKNGTLPETNIAPEKWLED